MSFGDVEILGYKRNAFACVEAVVYMFNADGSLSEHRVAEADFWIADYFGNFVARKTKQASISVRAVLDAFEVVMNFWHKGWLAAFLCGNLLEARIAEQGRSLCVERL